LLLLLLHVEGRGEGEAASPLSGRDERWMTTTRGWVIVVVVCGGMDEDDVDEDEVGEEEVGTRRHHRHRIRRDKVGENTTRARPCRCCPMWRDKAMARRRCRRVWRDGLGDDGDGAPMSFIFMWRGHVAGESTRRG
jgi:hypothetical protein